MPSDTIQLDASVFDDCARDDATLARFATRLKKAVKGADVEPMPDMDLAGSLEVFMRIGRHALEFVPAHLETASNPAQPSAAFEASTTLCDATMALAIDLRRDGAPKWAFGRLRAPEAFRAMAAASEALGNKRRALHWAVALMLAPSTLLVQPGTPIVIDRTDAARLIAFESELGPSAVHEEIEAWHDLYLSYGLFR